MILLDYYFPMRPMSLRYKAINKTFRAGDNANRGIKISGCPPFKKPKSVIREAGNDAKQNSTVNTHVKGTKGP